MDRIERLLSRPTAKPYRSRQIEAGEKPFLNDNGLLDFAPGDIENPKNWSEARRWYITIVSVLMVVNATFASSSPSGTLDGIASQFGVSIEASGLVVTLFLLGYCFGPVSGFVVFCWCMREGCMWVGGGGLEGKGEGGRSLDACRVMLVKEAR